MSRGLTAGDEIFPTQGPKPKAPGPMPDAPRPSRNIPRTCVEAELDRFVIRHVTASVPRFLKGGAPQVAFERLIHQVLLLAGLLFHGVVVPESYCETDPTKNGASFMLVYLK